MKKSILSVVIVFASLFTHNVLAQNTVELNIMHKLGSADFAFNASGTTSLGQTFTADRLEYYLSQFSITHDGGQNTVIEDVYVLVNAGAATSIDLGSHNIDNVESISFYLGVDYDANHADPAQWPSSHALALKSPSMHWGWASGYRFLAIEGMMGNNADFEIHALGDDNYFENTVDVAVSASNGAIAIDIYGDYAEILNDIDLTGGLINHGSTKEAKKSLENCRDLVFSSVATTDTTDTASANGIEALNQLLDVTIAPNPSIDGSFVIQLPETSATSDVEIRVFDFSGKEILVDRISGGSRTMNVSSLASGMYFVQVKDNTSESISVKKVAVL
jgi:hypothetical protein